MDVSEEYLTPAQAARLLGINKRHLLQLPLARLRYGYRTIRFRRADIDAFVQHITSSGSEWK